MSFTERRITISRAGDAEVYSFCVFTALPWLPRFVRVLRQNGFDVKIEKRGDYEPDGETEMQIEEIEGEI